MHPDLEKLIVLQSLDLELKRLRDETDALPRHLASLAARSAAAQATLIGIQDSLVREEKLRRSLESDTRDQNGRAARAKRQMDVVTTTAQAAALEHEIAFTQAEVRRLEDAEIESMERTETLEGQQVEATSSNQAAETLLERERLRASDQLATNTTSSAALASERKAMRPTIGETALAVYDRVAKAKGTGIAEGVDQKCSACQMLVRPQKWNDLRDRSDHETIMTCETCGRLLYWDPARDAPVKKAAQTVPAIGTGGKADAR